MSHDPYRTPDAPVAARDESPDVPDSVLRNIRAAWIAAAVSGTVTLVVTLFVMSGAEVLSYTAFNLLDVALIFGLAFGIYRRSRACAVIMLVYFVGSKIWMWTEVGKPDGLFLAVLFTYFYVRGVQGTYAYHQATRSLRATVPDAA